MQNTQAGSSHATHMQGYGMHTMTIMSQAHTAHVDAQPRRMPTQNADVCACVLHRAPQVSGGWPGCSRQQSCGHDHWHLRGGSSMTHTCRSMVQQSSLSHV